MTASNSLFSLKNIACRRGGRVLFRNLALNLDKGDVLHLAGPNGAGKTSLLRIMAGALPFEGGIFWNNEDFLEKDHAARFSFLPADDKSLKLLETAGENLSFWASLYKGGDVDAALAAFDLASLKHRAVKYFSSGQKRRLSLARLVLKPAQLWLLDEPLNGLDASSAQLFRAALDAHISAGNMAVIASHLPVDPPREGNLRRIVLGAAEQAAA